MDGKLRRVHRRQVSNVLSEPTGTEFTGAATITTTSVESESLLADNSVTGGQAPITSIVSTTSSSSVATSSAAETSQSSDDSDSISVGAVIGICVGVFAALSIVLLLFFYFGSKRHLGDQKGVGKETERRKSGREVWVKMEEKDGDGSYEKYAIKRMTMTSTAPSAGTGTTVGRSITVKSAKSARTFKSLGYGTNLGLSETFKTPDLPPHLEFTDVEIGSGRSFVGEMPGPFPRVVNPPISWDGDTVGENDSYLSLKHPSDSIQFAGLNSPVSPKMVVSQQTPPAVETREHQWERAEVISPDGAEDAYGGVVVHGRPYVSRTSQETIRKPVTQPQSRDPPQRKATNPFMDPNPFNDPESSQPRNLSPQSAGTTSDSDSFFTTHSVLTQRTGAFGAIAATAVHHERVDSNEHAMASLIAALNITPEEAQTRLTESNFPTPRESGASGMSLGQQSTESRESEADTVALDEASFKQFPLPPTAIEHHRP